MRIKRAKKSCELVPGESCSDRHYCRNSPAPLTPCATHRPSRYFPSSTCPHPTPTPARSLSTRGLRAPQRKSRRPELGWQRSSSVRQERGGGGKKGQQWADGGWGGGNLAATPARRGAVDIPGLEQRSPPGQRLLLFFTKPNCWRRPERREPKAGRETPAGRPRRAAGTKDADPRRQLPAPRSTARGPAGPKSRTGSQE